MSKKFSFFKNAPHVPERRFGLSPGAEHATENSAAATHESKTAYRTDLLCPSGTAPLGGASVFCDGAPYRQQLGGLEKISPKVKTLLAERPDLATFRTCHRTAANFRLYQKKLFRRHGAYFSIAGLFGTVAAFFGMFFIAIYCQSWPVWFAFPSVFTLFLFVMFSITLGSYGAVTLYASGSREKIDVLLEHYETDPLISWLHKKTQAPFGERFSEKELQNFKPQKISNKELYRFSLFPSAKGYLDGIRKNGSEIPFMKFDVDALEALAEEDAKRGAEFFAGSG